MKRPHRACFKCAHLRRPGLADGYCSANRLDLPPAYGTDPALLRQLPSDLGESCPTFNFHPAMTRPTTRSTTR